MKKLYKRVLHIIVLIFLTISVCFNVSQIRKNKILDEQFLYEIRNRVESIIEDLDQIIDNTDSGDDVETCINDLGIELMVLDAILGSNGYGGMNGDIRAIASTFYMRNVYSKAPVKYSCIYDDGSISKEERIYCETLRDIMYILIDGIKENGEYDISRFEENLETVEHMVQRLEIPN